MFRNMCLDQVKKNLIHLLPNRLENCNYSENFIDFNKIMKCIFLCVPNLYQYFS